jgi:hypothetical protein
MNQDIITKLREPFSFAEVEAKVQVLTNDKTKGMAVFYVDSRAIQRRLDEVIGPFDWKNQYTQWQGTSQLCGIAIFNAERNEWVGKFDGAENTDIEAIKGGLSDAFKRAACVWGIGRYLYQIDGVWVEVEKRGNSTVIKQSEYSKLEKAYAAAVNRIFGTVVAESPTKKEPPAPAPQAPKKQSAVSAAPPPEATTPSSSTPTGDYTIKSVKPCGKGSQLLELVDNSGEITSAYIRAGDKSIATGSRLRMVEMEQKSGSFGPYNLINNYQFAA